MNSRVQYVVLLHTVDRSHHSFFFFFFNDTATTEIYTLSLHDALPILSKGVHMSIAALIDHTLLAPDVTAQHIRTLCREAVRSEEHTSELQSLAYLVCRLLLEKKKKHHKHTLPRTSQPRPARSTQTPQV